MIYKRLAVSMILSMLVLSLILVSAKPTTIDFKNYGKCVSVASKMQSQCLKNASIEKNLCLKQNKNNSLFNKSEIKILNNQCSINYKNNTLLCKENFKLNKDSCSVYKCNYNQNNKRYLNNNASFCSAFNTTLNITCNINENFFSDQCGCGCEKNTSIEAQCKDIFNTIKEEYNSAQYCTNDSDCNVSILNLPCTLTMSCSALYNKNYDLSKLLNLSEVYISNCKQVCPLPACINPELQEGKCINNKCQKVFKTDNSTNSTEDNLTKVYCEPKQRGNFCSMIYKPACGWFDSTKIQCLRYPCAQTFSNSCVACSNKNVVFFTEGECPKGL